MGSEPLSSESREAGGRIHVPEMEEILGRPIPVLDDGFVRVVDYMGADASVVQAARVSYGRGTKKVREDRGLIRYLMRHRHTTPFEMCEIKLHVRVPMDCWRQWVRHRTACLAEGTEIFFDVPGSLAHRGSELYKLKIEQAWRRLQAARNQTRADQQRNPLLRRERVQRMRLRQVDEDTLRIGHTRMVNVVRSGVKPVFRMVLADGKRIEATADHLFLFADGWHTLGSATGLHEQNGQAVWREGNYSLYVNGKRARRPAWYQDEAWLNDPYNRSHEVHGHHSAPVRADGSLARDTENRAAPGGKRHRKAHGCELDYVAGLGGAAVCAGWKKRPRVSWNTFAVAKLAPIEGFEYVGLRPTYDLEVEGPYHNFIANGIVTHNSVNEYSTRYSEAIDSLQKTGPGGWRSQSPDNRQGSGPPLDPAAGSDLSSAEREFHARARDLYERRLAAGVAREQARKDLPLSTYTEAYWKIDLHNLLHFLELRMEDHAQQEIRSYARAIGEQIVRRWCPLTWEAFLDYRVNALTLSAPECAVIRAAVSALPGSDGTSTSPLAGTCGMSPAVSALPGSDGTSPSLAPAAGGPPGRAVEAARQAGFLRPEADGWKRSRECLELEEKMRRLGLDIPWRAGFPSLKSES